MDVLGRGQKVYCPDCSVLIEVPYARDEHACPHCKYSVLVSYNLYGTVINCSSCGKPYLVQGDSMSNPSPFSRWGLRGNDWQHRFKEKHTRQTPLTGLQKVRRLLKTLAWGVLALGIGLFVIIGDSHLGEIGGSDMGSDEPWYKWPGILLWSGLALILVAHGRWINGTEEEISEHWASLPSRLMEITRDWFKVMVQAFLLVFVLIMVIVYFPTEMFKAWRSTSSSGEKTKWVSGTPKQSASNWRKGNALTALADGRQFSDVKINNYTVVYDDSVTREEASALARHRSDGTESGCFLMKYDGSYIVAQVISRDGASEQEIKSTCKIVAVSLDPAFNGAPVQACLIDRSMNILAVESNQDSGSEFHENSRSGSNESSSSLAYQRGYDHGKTMGEMDRNFGSYDHASTDVRLNESFYQVPAIAHYGMGSPEYGEFVSGYEQGYMEAR